MAALCSADGSLYITDSFASTVSFLSFSSLLLSNYVFISHHVVIGFLLRSSLFVAARKCPLD